MEIRASPVLINPTALSAILDDRYPGRWSTVRPSRFHHQQISWAGRQLVPVRPIYNAASAVVVLKSSPRRSIAQAIRASLLASATTAAFLCVRPISARSHSPRGVPLLDSLGRADRAPWISSLRRDLLPRLVMPTRRALPPVVTWRGTSPSQAARSRPRAKVCPLPT